MSIRTGRGAAAVFVALALASGARAAEQGERLGAVISARIEMQRQLGDWLTNSLKGPAEPYRVEVAVRVEMRGVVREIRAKQQSASPAVKIGGKSKVKLPGFGMVDGGGGGAAPLMPEINIEGGTRVTEQVSRQLETEVVRLTVLLFVDPVMPKERRDLLIRLATELAGMDKARGDEVVVEERPLPPQAGTAGTPTILQATIQTPPMVPYEVVAMCVTALIAAAILAMGLSRRAASPAGLPALLGGGRGGGDGDAHGAEGGAVAAQASAGAEAQRKRREDVGAFKVLADATPKEIVQIVAEADPYTALAIVDLFGLQDEGVKLLEGTLTPQRRLEIGLGLATPKVVTREQLGQMEAVAGQLLQRIRNRVALGGPARLAEFLTQAPPAVRQEVLDGVAARDPNLAQAARSAMLLFDDLPRLTDGAVRQVVTGVDPATVALALVGAPEAREVVLGAVSTRLRSIIEVEEELAAARPPEEIEKARRAIEESMRAVQARGELRTRDAAETPSADTAAA